MNDKQTGLEMAFINGTVYHVIASALPGPLGKMNQPGVKRLVFLRRPRGAMIVLAQDFGPHPVYGEGRRYRTLGNV